MHTKKQVVKLPGNEKRRLVGDALAMKQFIPLCKTGNIVN